MRYLAELVWNPDAILFNRDLEWQVLNQECLLVAVGKDKRRAEVRLRLDGNGDPISMEADARPRQVGRQGPGRGIRRRRLKGRNQD